MKKAWMGVVGAAAWAILPPAAEAYVGPGAGLDSMPILMGLLALVLVSLCLMLAWPIWSLIRRRRKAREEAQRAAEEGGQDAPPDAAK